MNWLETLGLIFILLIILSILLNINNIKKRKLICTSASIYDLSLQITERINKILQDYNYTIETEEQKALFTSVSSLYCYYFFEIVLKKYYNFNNNKCFKIINNLTTELSRHIIGVTQEQVLNLYLEIRKVLNNPPQVDLEEYVTLNYLIMSIQFNEEEIETKLLLDIYDEFNAIIENRYNIQI